MVLLYNSSDMSIPHDHVPPGIRCMVHREMDDKGEQGLVVRQLYK